VALASALVTSGCYKNTVVNDVAPPGPPDQEHTEHLTYFFWGLAGDHEIDTRAVCPNDVRQFTYQADALDVLVTTVTLGIVGLRSVEIECAGPVPARTASARMEGGRQ
jgi:hypothetical protein